MDYGMLHYYYQNFGEPYQISIKVRDNFAIDKDYKQVETLAQTIES
jgi:hypothetical protein